MAFHSMQLQLRTVAESHFEIVPSFAPINYSHAVAA